MEEQAKAAERLAAAAEALETTIAKLEARFAALEEKVDRIVAMVEEKASVSTAKSPTLSASADKGRARKTFSATASALLEKHGEGALTQESVSEVLRMLSVEQRIAVKAELARAGVIG